MIMFSDDSKPATLEPSKLGTQEYWDNLYLREKANHAANPSDKGTIWFDDSNAEQKILSFLHSRCADEKVPFTDASDDDNDNEFNEEFEFSDNDGQDENNTKQQEPPKDLTHSFTSFLDLGSGNGSLLFSLRKHGFAGRLHGIDYSHASVSFAQDIMSKLSTNPKITFSQWDILNSPYETVLIGAQASGFDVVLDKGTFDAISLCEETDVEGKRMFEQYPKRVLRLVKNGGLLVITSCNWTEEELKVWFAQRGGTDEGKWEVTGRVKYRVFSFGGVSGQTISTMCFRRV